MGSQALEQWLLKLKDLVDQLGDRTAVWVSNSVVLEIAPDASRHARHLMQVQLLQRIEKAVEPSQLPARCPLPGLNREMSRHIITVRGASLCIAPLVGKPRQTLLRGVSRSFNKDDSWREPRAIQWCRRPP